jgi:hypothetical protein
MISAAEMLCRMHRLLKASAGLQQVGLSRGSMVCNSEDATLLVSKLQIDVQTINSIGCNFSDGIRLPQAAQVKRDTVTSQRECHSSALYHLVCTQYKSQLPNLYWYLISVAPAASPGPLHSRRYCLPVVRPLVDPYEATTQLLAANCSTPLKLVQIHPVRPSTYP